MSSLRPLELEIATLLVDTLNLEVSPEAIEPEAPLYQEGLGLDSIDLLEISVVMSKRYGIQFKSDDPEITRIFTSLRTLSETVEARRANA
jgi:acyl carrier protein